jgi:hypothetical protein
MSKIKTLLMTTSILIGAVISSAAQNLPANPESDLPLIDQPMATSYSTLPEATAVKEDDEDGSELFTDHNAFYERGFMDFDWQTHTQYVEQVLNEVVIPDYIKRTGKVKPTHPSIDVAAAMITNPYFNDLIVQSRLPGDCKDDGCLVQIYSLVGEVWVKKFQTTTFAMLAKPGDKLGTVLLGLVGTNEIPSKTVLWTGAVFQDM